MVKQDVAHLLYNAIITLKYYTKEDTPLLYNYYYLKEKKKVSVSAILYMRLSFREELELIHNIFLISKKKMILKLHVNTRTFVWSMKKIMKNYTLYDFFSFVMKLRNYCMKLVRGIKHLIVSFSNRKIMKVSFRSNRKLFFNEVFCSFGANTHDIAICILAWLSLGEKRCIWCEQSLA